MQHIRDLTGPPVLGRYYLVPTVRGQWYGERRELPVLGPRHNDRQDLNFEPMHYHIDARFVGARRWFDFWASVAAQPVSETNRDGDPTPIDGPYDRKWLCKWLSSPWQGNFIDKALEHGRWQNHLDRWAGVMAGHDGKGWVCPHRQVALKDQVVADDGVIVCPLHNLHICNREGRVLSRQEIEARRGARSGGQRHAAT